MHLLHLILRQWRQRPARTALSIASVAIAVAAVLGVTLAQASVRGAYRKLLAATEGRPALEVVAADGQRFEPSQAGAIERTAGVQAVVPVVARATLGRVSGKRFRGVLLGLPLDTPEAWQTLPLVKGDICRRQGDAVVSAELAESLKFDVGDRLVVLGASGPRGAKIVGLVKGAALGEWAPAATMAMPLDNVQQYFRLGDRVNRLRVLLTSGDERDRTQAAIAKVLPAELDVQAPVAQLELAGGMLRSTELALRFAGTLSLAMAAFIVLNTMRMNFGERRRDMAVLRVLGVTARQLVSLQLIEGFALGLVGAVLGIPGGLLLGRGLAALMQRLAEAEATDIHTPYWTLLIALVAGPLVAGLSALVPAWQSRGISPVEALGDVEARRGERFPWWSVLAGSIAWSAAVALLVMVWLERLPAEAAIPAGVLMLVGFIAVIPALLRPVVGCSARLLAPWLRIEGSFAAEQLLERPTRTGLTAGVLVVAISAGIGLGNAILNNVDDVRGWYRRIAAGDIMLAGPAPGEGAVEAREQTSLRERLLAEPEIKRVVETRYLPARAGGVPTICVVHDIQPQVELPWEIAPGTEGALRMELARGDAVIGNGLARRLKLLPGDKLRLDVQGRGLDVRVCATVRDYLQGGLAVFLDQTAASKQIELGSAQIYTVITEPDRPVEPIVERLKQTLESEGLVILPYTQVRGQLDLLIGGIVGALWGLLMVGFVVGGLAVANTLSMSVFEQTRELGLLRIIGMTRAQVRRLIFCESLLLGILGTLLGALAGMTTAWIIHLGSEPLLGYSLPFQLHPWLLVANVGTCLVVSVLAAWLPGERAARLNLLAALASE